MDAFTPGAKSVGSSLTRLPRRWRVLLVIGMACALAGAGFLSYHWYTRPTTLTVAVGSQDGEAPKMVSAIASRLAQTSAPVRLSVKETTNPIESAAAFSSGAVDLAVVRGDVGDLSKAQAIAVVTHGVVLLVAPPGFGVDDVADLKRVVVGVVGGEINRKIVQILTREYRLDRANVRFEDLTLADTRRAVQAKDVALLLVVAPLTEKYIALLRGLFSQNGKALPVLLSIETAGAIAEREPAYEDFEIPKGTLRGSPASPADDTTTLKVPFYLVAKKELSNDVAAALAESLMNVRRDLVGEWPMLAQLSAPDLEPNAYLPVHPGAANFYNGNQLAFLDKWGNLIFLVPMVLGGLATIAAAGRKYLRDDGAEKNGDPLDRLYALGERIRTSSNPGELDEIENEIDRLLRAQRSGAVGDETEALNVTSLNVAAHRLETLISDRRAALAARGPQSQARSGGSGANARSTPAS